MGYDPGMSSGVAVLSLDGELLFSKVYKEKKDIVSDLVSLGKPVIVATDVPKIPHAVKKLANSFGCPVFRPHRYFSSYEKSEYLKKAGWTGLDIHESDALFAAQLCLSSKKKKLEQVINASGLSDQKLEMAVSLLLSGENVKEAVRRVSQIDPAIQVPIQVPIRAKFVNERRRYGSVKNDDKYRKELEEALLQKEALEIELDELRSSLTRMSDERERQIYRDREVAELEDRLKKAQESLQEKDRELRSFKANYQLVLDFMFSVAISKTELIPKLVEPSEPQLKRIEGLSGGVKTIAFENGGPLTSSSIDWLRKLGVEFVLFLRGEGPKVDLLVEKGIYPISIPSTLLNDLGDVLTINSGQLKSAQASAKRSWHEVEMERKRGLLRSMLSKT